MATTKKGQETPRVALAQIEDLMKTSGQRGDALRADGLAGLTAVKRAKLIQTRRERTRVALRHGEASEEVARLDRKMAIEHRFLVNTRAEVDRVATPSLERDDKVWQVHGYVRSQDGLARAGYGVALLADTNGRKTLAETTTDKRGYFNIGFAQKGKETPVSDAPDRTDDAKAEDATKDKKRTENDRVARVLAQALKTSAFLGVTASGQSEMMIDERPLHPVAGAIAFRDITVANAKDDGSVCQLKTRLLGNSGSRELHNLENEKPGCQIAEIRPDHRFYFQSTDQAEKLGYDFCAYCFGRARSKR